MNRNLPNTYKPKSFDLELETVLEAEIHDLHVARGSRWRALDTTIKHAARTQRSMLAATGYDNNYSEYEEPRSRRGRRRTTSVASEVVIQGDASDYPKDTGLRRSGRESTGAQVSASGAEVHAGSREHCSSPHVHAEVMGSDSDLS